MLRIPVRSTWWSRFGARALRRLLALLLLATIAVVASWLAWIAEQVRDSSRRLGTPTSLALHSGGDVRVVLLIGSDRRRNDQRTRASGDSVMLVRLERDRPARVLSLPRDLLISDGRRGRDSVSNIYTERGVAGVARAVTQEFDVRLTDVAFLDLPRFRRLVDAVGGVVIDNPRPLVTNEFDGYVWRFGRGRLHLDGRRALAYVRARSNALNPNESESDRNVRQQRVLRALVARVQPQDLLRHPLELPDALFGAVAVSSSPVDLARLALHHRDALSSRMVNCRLGGQAQLVKEDVAVEGIYMVGYPENEQVLAMFTGDAPAGPVRKDPRYPAGCSRS